MNDPQLLALISQAVNWAFLIVLVGGLALVIVVTARRPADDRDAFIRDLPPPSQPLAVRSAHLRILLRQAVKKHVKVYAVIAGVLVVIGVLASWSVNRPIWEGIAAMAVTFGLPGVFVVVFNGLYLFARYRGAQRRILNDTLWYVQWYGPSDEHTSPVPHDTSHASAPELQCRERPAGVDMNLRRLW
jgi:hypothetical protein